MSERLRIKAGADRSVWSCHRRYAPAVGSRPSGGGLRGGSGGRGPVRGVLSPVHGWLAVDIVPGEGGALVYVWNRTPCREHEQSLTALRQRLTRGKSIDEVMTRVLRDVVGVSGREELARTVCAGLNCIDRYDFCWVSTRRPGPAPMELVDAARGATDIPDRVVNRRGGGASLPEQRAVTAGETQAVESVAEDESVSCSVRVAAFGRGFQPVAAVPIAYWDTFTLWSASTRQTSTGSTDRSWRAQRRSGWSRGSRSMQPAGSVFLRWTGSSS